MAVDVTIPRMLAELVKDERHFEVEGATVGEVLHGVTVRHPVLAVHLFDESGTVRPHVSVFLNGRMTELAVATSAGDELVVLQAVSGG